MRRARFADREYEKQGLFELPKPPTTPPVCGPGATTTPGGLLSDMREAFLAIPGMDAMKVELIVNTDMHLTRRQIAYGVYFSLALYCAFLRSNGSRVFLSLAKGPENGSR